MTSSSAFTVGAIRVIPDSAVPPGEMRSMWSLVFARIVQIAQEMGLPVPVVRMTASDTVAVDLKGYGEAMRFDGDLFRCAGASWEPVVRSEFRRVAVPSCIARERARQKIEDLIRARHEATPRAHIPDHIEDLMLCDHLQQREDMRPNRQQLKPEQRERVSAEWSRRLRELQSAAKHKERHQVVCDYQDEP